MVDRDAAGDPVGIEILAPAPAAQGDNGGMKTTDHPKRAPDRCDHQIVRDNSASTVQCTKCRRLGRIVDGMVRWITR